MTRKIFYSIIYTLKLIWYGITTFKVWGMFHLALLWQNKNGVVSVLNKHRNCWLR